MVVGEASESEDDSDKSDYRSDSSQDSHSSHNLATISLSSAKSGNLNKSANSSHRQSGGSFLTKKLSLRDDRYAGNESNLINERLTKDNRLFRQSIVSFGTQRYQQTIDELNELNQSLIKSQEKIQNANQYIEKTKSNLASLNENLDEIFKSFDQCRLKL